MPATLPIDPKDIPVPLMGPKLFMYHALTIVYSTHYLTSAARGDHQESVSSGQSHHTEVDSYRSPLFRDDSRTR
jgi:hypothetical protein